jgi:hypothetical protein
LIGTLHEHNESPRPVRRQGPTRLRDVAVREGAHRSCVQAARAGACAACITIVDAIIDRSGMAAKHQRLPAT